MGQRPSRSSANQHSQNSAYDEFERMMSEFAASGTLDPRLQDVVLEMMSNPEQVGQALSLITSLGLDELVNDLGTSPTLNIADYYRPGSEKYELHWPLPSGMQLPAQFDELDRATQFHVLFTEWSRREMEASAALTSGRIDEAEVIYQECARRADQLDVSELRARSFEGLMRVAQARNDVAAERKWTQAALEAREGQG